MKEKLKNIIIIYDVAFYSGGAAKIAIDSAIELANRGYNVTFFAGIGPVCEELNNSLVNTICLNQKHITKARTPLSILKGIWNNSAYKQLVSLLKQYDSKDTIIHIHGWTKCLSPSIFKAIRKNGFKCTITMHEFFLICQNGGLYNYQKKQICKLKPSSFKCEICNCDKRNYINKMYRNVKQFIQTQQLKKLNSCGIYITNFSRNLIHNNLNFNFTKTYLLKNYVDMKKCDRVKVENNNKYAFVGRISDEKGIDLFCEYITKSGHEGVVIGDGIGIESLKEKYKNIEFMGWLSYSQMNKKMNEIRAIVITSKWYETMGLTVVEMQNMGVPSMIPIHCAATENSIDMKNAIFYDVNNYSSYLDAIKKMDDYNIALKLSECCYKMNREDFLLSTHIDGLIDIYNDVI